MTHLSACPPPPPLLAMSAASGDPAASSQSAFFPHLIADFQRSLHSRLLSVVHTVSTSSTAASPLSVHQWLQEQLVQCLDAERRYIIHSPPPPSLPSPPHAALAMSSALPELTAPQQLSNALNELTLSAAEAINNAARQRQHIQQQQQQQLLQQHSERHGALREEEHKVGHATDSDILDERTAGAYGPSYVAPRRSSISRSHRRPHHHHHHGHAVEVSVRCLPNSPAAPVMAAAYPRAHSHDEDDDTSTAPLSAVAYTHTASSSYALSTAVTTKREREDMHAATTRSASPSCCSPTNHSSFLSPLPCLPNCNLPPMSPCSSSSPCLDFNCLDPTPFSLCDDDPLCCFPSFSPTDDTMIATNSAHHNGAMPGGDGTSQYTDNGDALCSSPLSSVCLPMPCDPCAVSTASLSTTTTTTTLLSCVPCDDVNCGEEDSSTASRPNSPIKLDDDEDKQLTAAPLSSNQTDSANNSQAGIDHKTQTANPPSTPRSSISSSAAAASPSVMLSCHQCKLKKPSTQCMQCTCSEQKSSSAGKKRCVKKYCAICLLKHYNFQMAVKEDGAEQAEWICPACKGVCSCAACARRKLMDEEEANMVSAIHHHHTHAHVTIHSLPHHHHSHPLHGHPMPPPTLPSLRASCHQCKSSKSSMHLLACSSRRSLTADGKRLRDCKKKYCAVCLPEHDTRVLTDTGFLFLSDIEMRVADKEEVKYACYDIDTQSIVYRAGELVIVPAPKRWVDLTQAGTRRLWDEDSSDNDGASMTADGVKANYLTLRTTPGHDMYVQLCTGYEKDDHERYEPRMTRGAPIPPHKMRAEELAPGYQCDCVAAGHTCTHGYSHYRMYTGAPSGLNAPADIISLTDCDERSPVTALGLHHKDELDAFLELFGYWLGHGFLSHDACAGLTSANAVCFAPRQACDRVYLQDLLTRLQLACCQHFTSNESDLRLEVRIIEPRWFHFFDNEFGVMCNRRLALLKQRTHSTQRRLSASSLVSASPTESVSLAGSTRARSVSNSASFTLGASVSGYRSDDDMSPLESDQGEDDLAESVKWLPDWTLLRLDAQQLRLVLEGLWHADGGGELQDERRICASNVGLRDQLVHACVHAGYSAYFKLKSAAGEVCGYNAMPYDHTIYTEEDRQAELQVDPRRQFEPVRSQYDSWWVCYTEEVSHLLSAQDVRYDGRQCRIRQVRQHIKGWVAVHDDGVTVQRARTQDELAGLLACSLSHISTAHEHGRSACGVWSVLTAAEYEAERSEQAQEQATTIATQPADLYDQQRDGRVWCVKVQHDDHLIFVQRVHRSTSGIVTKVGRTMITGQCLDRWYGLDMDDIKRKEREGGPAWRCPACEGVCPCAACRRKGGRKREEGKDDEEDTVDGSDEEEEVDRRAKRGRFVHHHHMHAHSHVPHHHHHTHGHTLSHQHPHSHSHPYHVHHNHLQAPPIAALQPLLSDVSAASVPSAAYFASTAVSETAVRGDSSVDSDWDNGWAANGGTYAAPQPITGVKAWVDSHGPPALRNRA